MISFSHRVRSMGSSLIDIILSIKNTIVGLCNFIIGSLNLAQYFAENNFERIIKAVFLFAALLLVQVNPYISLLLAVAYLIYEVRVYIDQEIASVQDPVVQDDQRRKWELLRNISGFCFDPEIHGGMSLERLSEEVYDFCREIDKPKHKDSIAFRGLLNELNFDDPNLIIRAKETGISTVLTRHNGSKSLLALTAGTDFLAFNRTLLEDIDNSGPGRQAFLKHRDDIIGEIIEASKGLDYINLAGHSFGGAISMMIAVELMKEVEKGNLDIKGINVSIYQSAGVNEKVACEAKEVLSRLGESHPEFKLNMISHYHDYDPIPGSGIQILGDYQGENAQVFAVRRHLSFEGFSVIATSPLKIIDLAHKGHIYDNPERDGEHEIIQAELKEGSITQIYYDGGYNPESKDRQYILDRFLSTHTKFVCNESMYKFFSKHEPLVWKTLIMGVAFGLCLLGTFVNLGYILFVPGIYYFYNFYCSLSAPVVTYYYFRQSYRELLKSRTDTPTSSEDVASMPVMTADKHAPTVLDTMLNVLGIATQ